MVFSKLKMKMKILLTSLLILFTLSGYSQYFDSARNIPVYTQKHAISFVFQPTDLGIGLRYDNKITSNFGLYSSVSWGNYRLENRARLNNHFKFSMGVTKYIPNLEDTEIKNIFSVALTYHSYGEMNGSIPWIPEKTFFPISLDLGAGIIIKRISTGILADFFKREGSVYVGRYF